MWKEFRDFALRGNVMDMAIGVIIGAAFGNIVTSLVDNILTPIIGMITGGINFSALSVKVGSAELMYGAFIQSIIDFLLIALCIFLMVKAINKLHTKKEEEATPAGPTDTELLTDIRDLLKEQKK